MNILATLVGCFLKLGLRRPIGTGGVCIVLALLCATGGLIPQEAYAQEPTERQLRTYIPPEQLVSFRPSTPFDQFVEFLNPIFISVTGKQVIDPEGRSFPIGVPITRLQFFDALELVLEAQGLTYRETDRFFIVEDAPEDTRLYVGDEVEQGVQPSERPDRPASISTSEVKINALLFEVNLSRVRELGLNWGVFLGQTQSGGQTGGETSDQGPRFRLRPQELGGFLGDLFNDDAVDSPEEIDFGDLARFFRALEEDGIGRTLAQPTVAVQSGEEGRIQIGSDIPIQVRDFAGNTITQFISTGIIVDVVPTLLTEPVADTAGAPLLDFVHLDVEVERSSGRPFGASVAIDRNTADTQILLLDREQTLIGGLYSTDVSATRRGIPILKDLPPWFFGLRYIFGRTTRTIARRELLIVLQAEILDPLPVRANRPLPSELLEKRRRAVQERIERFDEDAAEEYGPGEVLPSLVEDD